jgi:glucose-6-phosphate 1-dehydrogenase
MADDRPITGKASVSAPLSKPRHKAPPADPCVMVLFGATGDLTRRLVVPALYNLAKAGTLPKDFALIGVARSEDSTEGWRKQLLDALKGFAKAGETFRADGIEEAVWNRLAETMSFVQGDLTKPELYEELKGAIETATKAHRTKGNVLFYLAVADSLFAPIVERLGAAGLAEQAMDSHGKARFWRRVVVEKPFGHSLDSARELNARLLKVLGEDQIFRIDHFLGKDTVQSIIAFRFANGLFEPIWNRDRIDHVQITAAETVGVEQRGEFYEQTGALRDMVPNHLLSLLCLVAMEPPTGFDAAAIREKKADVLAAMPVANPAKAVRGQYAKGRVLHKAAKAYSDEPDVSVKSRVETYAALELEIDNWRWAGVPFFLRTGKHLERRVTEIAIAFKPAPYSAFQDTPVDALRPNNLVIRIAPDEGISLQFEVKRRGPVVELAPVRMQFCYDDWFPREANVGYEILLYDVMIGDPTLFMRADMIEHGWRIVQPVLDAWAKEKPDFPDYASGAEGPKAADELIARSGHGRRWRSLTEPDE